jgi:GrpB-like predicted nucleotidyltransferase (UPF0157 family)
MGNPIQIIEYSPAWPGEFQHVGKALRAALGSLARRIDHIGSTAVVNLAAKDIIDVQVTVDSLDPPDPIIQPLTATGYVLRDRITHDHVPPGHGSDPAPWRKLFFINPRGIRRINLHVRITGQPNQRYPLLFRDYLQGHSMAASAYASLKRQLATRFPNDIEAYCDVKDPACDIIMAAAEDWAAAGWVCGCSDA